MAFSVHKIEQVSFLMEQVTLCKGSHSLFRGTFVRVSGFLSVNSMLAYGKLYLRHAFMINLDMLADLTN